MDWHKFTASLGVAAAGVIPMVALQYKGNWKVAVACVFAGSVLNALGFTVVKPLVKDGDAGEQ